MQGSETERRVRLLQDDKHRPVHTAYPQCLEWTMNHQDQLQSHISRAQDYIEAHYPPRVISDQCENVPMGI